jgi:hypothetical protein
MEIKPAGLIIGGRILFDQSVNKSMPQGVGFYSVPPKHSAHFLLSVISFPKRVHNGTSTTGFPSSTAGIIVQRFLQLFGHESPGGGANGGINGRTLHIQRLPYLIFLQPRHP